MELFQSNRCPNCGEEQGNAGLCDACLYLQSVSKEKDNQGNITEIEKSLESDNNGEEDE